MANQFTTWLKENYPKESTRKRYTACMKKFLRHIYGENSLEDSNDLDELSEKYLKEERELSSDLKSFIQSMKEEGLSPNSQNLYSMVVKLFAEEEGEGLGEKEWERIRRRFLPKAKPVTRSTYPDKTELRKILTHVSAKGESLFLFLSSSGTRIGAALQFRVEDLSLDADPPRARIRSGTSKNTVARTVYFTYEARDAIKEWLREKKGLGKKTGDGGTYGGKRVWPMTYKNAREMWSNALEKAGLAEKSPESGILIYHLHTLRKFFKNNLRAKQEIREALMGHEGYLNSAYGPSDRDMEEAYKKAIDSVTIRQTSGGEIRGEMNKSSLNNIIDFLKALGISEKKIRQKVQDSQQYSVENGFEEFEDPVDNDTAKEIKKNLLSLAEDVKSKKFSTPPEQKCVEPKVAEKLVNEGKGRYLDSLSNDKVVIEIVS